jgi:acyl carrier protein
MDVSDSDSIIERVRKATASCMQVKVDVSSLGDEDSLYEAGMTSRASVNLMLALENEFDIEFPDRLLRRDVFESVASIASAIQTLFRG